ncbi:MAG: SPASM domain-containing protein, partial [Candidatus Zixiibacteriota bacterium]
FIKNPHRKQPVVKASRFNTFAVLDNGNKILFNSQTGALAELDADSYSKVSAILEDPVGEFADDNSQVRQQLLYGGFLVEDYLDQIAAQKIEYARQRYGKGILRLAIAPTLECSLLCDSCSGRKHKMRIRLSAEKFLTKFIDNHARRADQIEVTYFGGDPLLEIDTMERIQAHLADSAARHGIPLRAATVITNGTLLDRVMALRLKEAGVLGAQVTLNGPREMHNQSRKLSDGEGSFGRIISNISDSAVILDVVVRINLSSVNVGDVSAILDSLRQVGVLSKVRVCLTSGRGKAEVCTDAVGLCRQGEQDLKNHLSAYSELSGQSQLRLDFPFLIAEPSCPTDCDSSFIIAPSGYVFKCWEDVSAMVDNSVDTIFDRPVDAFQHQNLMKYTLQDRLDNNNCKTCAILPVCRGGCAVDICEQTEPMSGKCKFWRDNLQDLLKLRHLYETREEAT